MSMGRDLGRNSETMIKNWLALIVGNSRLHWAWFAGSTLQLAWDTPHQSDLQIQSLIQQGLNFAACPDFNAEQPDLPAIAQVPAGLPLWLASVVPTQTSIWQTYPLTQVVTLSQIPIAGLYPTLGIDRALALLGAKIRYGQPCLVIDAGTALTLTGVDAANTLVGGAILPGLQLQLRSLSEHTAALPLLSGQPAVDLAQLSLPHRWATRTSDAIWSGVVYSLLAGLRDFIRTWQQQFPETSVVFTGGDAPLIVALLRQQFFDWAVSLQLDAQLGMWGIQHLAMRLD
jgi:type III pantothenate kinase